MNMVSCEFDVISEALFTTEISPSSSQAIKLEKLSSQNDTKYVFKVSRLCVIVVKMLVFSFFN